MFSRLAAMAIYIALLIPILILLSPLIIISLLIQPFTDTGVINFFQIVVQNFTDIKLAKSHQNSQAPPSPPKKKKRTNYLDTLPYTIRRCTEDKIKNSGYKAENDPKALHHKLPFTPSFILPHDTDLYDDLAHEWKYYGDMVYCDPSWVKSYWDRKGYKEIEEIFLSPYIAPLAGIQINNAEEHKWILETMAIPYYEVEYCLKMLTGAHSDDNSIGDTKEFRVRYKILSKIFNTQKSLFEKGVKVTTDSNEKIKHSQSSSLVDGLWGVYWAWQDAELYYNQRQFFAREAKKNR